MIVPSSAVDKGLSITQSTQLPPLSEFFPKHSGACRDHPERRCYHCNEIFSGLTDESIAMEWERDEVRRGAIVRLPKSLIESIALALAENPKIFAPVIQFLTTLKETDGCSIIFSLE